MNPEVARSNAALVKNHLQELIYNESLDHNGNQMLDIHDSEHFIRNAMGTYPGQALTTGCCEDPTNLISIEEQFAVLEADPVFA